MIVFNALFPVFFLLTLGYFLRTKGYTDSEFLKKSDSLVYYVFFPLMLFYKIGGARYDAGLPFNLVWAAMTALFVTFVVSLLYCILSKMDRKKVGAFSQSCYRFNTYIGLAVIVNSIGEAGITVFGFMLGFVIPLVNVGAVSILIWFSDSNGIDEKRSVLLVKALGANPLIWGCFAGIVFASTGTVFPVFLDNTLKMMSQVTLPLALFSVGGTLSTIRMGGYLRISLASCFFKLLLLPCVGYVFLRLFQVDDISMSVGMIFFSLPASTAIYVLSAKLGGDTLVASSVILLSTFLSILSLSAVLIIFL